MHTLFVTLLGASLLMFLAACSKQETETASKPMPAPAETSAANVEQHVDPTVADPDHYRAEFENDAVRIVRINYGPGEESVMHYHPDSVAVFLTDLDIDMTFPDGITEPAAAPAGTAVFNKGASHLPKNTSDTAMEVVEIELKSPSSNSGAANGPDPVVVDSDHYTLEFENDRVRIVRIEYGAGEDSVMHYHPDSVAVFLTDHLVEMTTPDGTTAEIAAAAGDAMFIPGGQHLPKNISGSAWELVLVELK